MSPDAHPNEGIGCACGWPLDRCMPQYARGEPCDRERHEASQSPVPKRTDSTPTPAEWLRGKAEYTSSLSMSGVLIHLEAGDLRGVLHALARQAEREEAMRRA